MESLDPKKRQRRRAALYGAMLAANLTQPDASMAGKREALNKSDGLRMTVDAGSTSRREVPMADVERPVPGLNLRGSLPADSVRVPAPGVSPAMRPIPAEPSETVVHTPVKTLEELVAEGRIEDRRTYGRIRREWEQFVYMIQDFLNPIRRRWQPEETEVHGPYDADIDAATAHIRGESGQGRAEQH